jgi:hypothetical protein
MQEKQVGRRVPAIADQLTVKADVGLGRDDLALAMVMGLLLVRPLPLIPAHSIARGAEKRKLQDRHPVPEPREQIEVLPTPILEVL